MPLNDFYRSTTKAFYINVLISGSAPDISSDTMNLYLRDETKIILSSSADMAASGSIGRAYFNISSSLTNIPAECYYYNILWHLSTGEDYIVDKSSVNVKEIYSGSV